MKKFIFLFALVSMFSFAANAQPAPNAPAKKGSVKGKIVESGSNVPLEYANVAIYNQKDSSLVSGAITDEKGYFTVDNMPFGLFYIEAKFIGYEGRVFNNYRITQDRPNVDMGVIELYVASEQLGEVNVVAQERAVSYQIDKKVVDPSQFPTAANGTAVDILSNTPSVTVDIEGNVALRGSSDFTVYIDGKPTPFSSADALRQMPASQIRNIEIVTNPSAKFDPDGNAGIININTKKSKFEGVSGIVNGSYDTNNSLNGDFLLNVRKNKFNYFIGGNISQRKDKGHSESDRMTILTDTINTVSIGNSDRQHKSYSAKAGVDYFINSYNTLSANVSVNSRTSEDINYTDYNESSSNGTASSNYTVSNGFRDGTSYSFNIDYKKTFAVPGQELTASVFRRWGNDEEGSYSNQYNNISDMILTEGLENWEDGESDGWRAKVDYVHPINDEMKLEAGYQGRFNSNDDWNDLKWYTVDGNYEASPSSPYYTESKFTRNIHSLYAMLSDQFGVWGYQVGLRGEYTDRNIEYSGSTDDLKMNRFDLFPTAHFSFELSSDQQMTASYTRRIQRPQGFFLEPFVTYEDAYNVRSGNPNILPEYIGSYEIGYQKTFKKRGFFSAEAYYRQTNNKVDRVQSVYAENVMLSTMANVGKDYSTGVELMVNVVPAKWWSINLMGNIYNYRMNGEYLGEEFDTKSNNWNARFSNTFTITPSTKIQFDGMYNSPTTTSQGRREGFMFSNIALRQDFFENKLNATLSVRDVFNTAKFEHTSEGTNFRSHSKFDMKSPVVALTLSYKFNNYKQQVNKSRSSDSEFINDSSDMMDMSGSGSMGE